MALYTRRYKMALLVVEFLCFRSGVAYFGLHFVIRLHVSINKSCQKKRFAVPFDVSEEICVILFPSSPCLFTVSDTFTRVLCN